MGSIGSVSAIPYMPALVGAEEPAAETSPTAPGKTAANAAAARPTFLAPQTVAALLIEQARKQALVPGGGAAIPDFRSVGLSLLTLTGADLRSPGLAASGLLPATMTGLVLSADSTGPTPYLPGAATSFLPIAGDLAGSDFVGVYLGPAGTDGDGMDAQWVADGQTRLTSGPGGGQSRSANAHKVSSEGDMQAKSLFLLSSSGGDHDREGIVTTHLRPGNSEASGLAMANLTLRGIPYANPALEGARIANSGLQYTAFLLTDLMAAHLARTMGGSARRAAERDREERRRLLRRRLQWRLSLRRQGR